MYFESDLVKLEVIIHFKDKQDLQSLYINVNKCKRFFQIEILAI